jgi:5-methyltetrahydrofolate--homocysteine methyltransferase
MADLSKLKEAILNGDAAGATAAAKDLMAASTDPLEVVTQGISPSMAEVGRRFEAGEYFVPELLVAARATKAVFEVIRPAMARRGTEPAGRVVIGTVKGDLHDIGKNLVAAMLEGGGFEVIDLGVNVGPDRIINAVKEKNAQLVGLSALLTTTMPEMKNAVEALKGAGLRDRVKVMIGGAPVTQQFAQEVGADGFGENAASAVGLARKLLGLPPQN